jgi:hypothetical protein
MEKKMSEREVVVGGTYRDWKGDLYSVFSKIPIKSKFKKGTTLGASMGFSLCETDLNPGDVGIVYGHSTQRFIQEESNFLEVLGDKDEGTMYYRFELVSIQDSGQDPKLEAARKSLEAAREIRQLRREHGADYIHLVVDDVEGSWLDQWGEDEILDSEEFQEKLNLAVQAEQTLDQKTKFKAAEEALGAARELQQMRRSHGVDRIKLLVTDVDGDWLENWDEPPCA